MIEVGKGQEALKLSECCRGWPVTNDLDLGWIYMDNILIYNVSKALDLVHVEGTFL
jgi:maltodextrin utilization protein YvdJ